MKKSFFLWALLSATSIHADTLANYMSIEKKIPEMQLKADMSAHAWARSARKILVLHDEALSESINEMNALSQKSGHPLFCLPSTKTITPESIHKILLTEASRIPEESQKRLSAAQVAISAIQNHYACIGKQAALSNAQPSGENDYAQELNFDDSDAKMQSVRSDDA